MKREKTGVSKTALSIIGVAAATIVSRALGMVREMAIAGVYGAGMESDAIVLALNIPMTLVACIGSAVGDAYIPYYNGTDAKERMRVSNNLFWLLVVFGVLLSAALCFFPQIVVRFFALGFSGERMNLACRIVRWIIWVIIPVLLAKLLGAYLQVHQSFAVVNATGILINLFIIAVVYLSSGKADVAAYIGIGACIGYYLQLAVLCYAAAGKNWTFSMPRREGGWGIRNYLYLGIPILFSAGVKELQNIADKNFASILEAGIMSNIDYALKISGIIYSVMFAVATVLFPKLAGLNDKAQKEGLVKMLRRIISRMYALILPVTVGCAILAEPIVEILFERGNFTSTDTLVTASALRIYAIEFMAICLTSLLIRIFYTLYDMKTPLICSCIAVAINIILNFALIERWQYRGLAAATVVSDICLCILLIVCLYRKYDIKLISKNSIWGMGIVGSLLMGVYVSWIYHLTKSCMDNVWSSIGVLCGIVLSAVILYGAALGVGVFVRWKFLGKDK